MASLFRNLFTKSNAEDNPEMEKSNAAEPYSLSTDATHAGVESTYASTSGQPIQKEPMEVNHVRANMQQRWVSAEDFMSYVDPTLTEGQIQYSISRLMRQAYIKAQWPPNKATPEGITRLTFVAVAFDNLYLLFDDDCEDWETPETKQMKRKTRQFQIDSFISDMEYIHANGSYQSKTDRIIVLVADAKKTASQVRYERDVRERITKGPEYYRLKRWRDQKQRAKQAQRKSAPVALCDICNKPSNNHWMWCRIDATTRTI